MRNLEISEGDHYHVFNRGVRKQNIFHDRTDFTRFLFYILFLQSSVNFLQISRPVQQYVKHSVFDIDEDKITEIIDGRYVELVAFCFMPNHFHLLLKEFKKGGIARYMQRVLNGYTKYYNTKYQKSGHLFQGPYKAVYIESDKQLLYLSTYIHRNPRELPDWKVDEQKYPWSSYQDYIKKNRWGKLLIPDLILEQFLTEKEYALFVETSTAKMSKNESGIMFDS